MYPIVSGTGSPGLSWNNGPQHTVVVVQARLAQLCLSITQF